MVVLGWGLKFLCLCVRVGCMRKYKILLESGLSPAPYKHELNAAGIMMEYFESDLLFCV